MSTPSRVEILAVHGIGEVGPGAELAELLLAARPQPAPGDVLVISQKVISKAEGRLRDLDRVEPREGALRLADELGKDPAVVELVLAESARVVRAERGVLITETHGGLVCANAGIDSSNVPGERTVALLPAEPDASARSLRRRLTAVVGGPLAVIVADSFGRPWRVGQTEVAIGCAGLSPLDDWGGLPDREGRPLAATAIAIADEIASAADLARSKGSGHPVAIVRGLGRVVSDDDGPGAVALRRARSDDLFP